MKAFSHDPQNTHLTWEKKVSASHGGSVSPPLFPSKRPPTPTDVSPSQLLLGDAFSSLQHVFVVGTRSLPHRLSLFPPATCCAAAISTVLRRHYTLGLFRGDGTALRFAPAPFQRDFPDLFHVDLKGLRDADRRPDASVPRGGPEPQPLLPHPAAVDQTHERTG